MAIAEAGVYAAAVGGEHLIGDGRRGSQAVPRYPEMFPIRNATFSSILFGGSAEEARAGCPARQYVTVAVETSDHSRLIAGKRAWED